MTVRTRFAPSSDAEVTRTFAAAFGHQCYVCRRQPWPAGLTYKNLSVCAKCAPLAYQRESMNDVTHQEEEAGMAGMDRAGEYLASIDKFDLTTLTEDELKQFNAHWLCGFSEKMRDLIGVQPPF